MVRAALYRRDSKNNYVLAGHKGEGHAFAQEHDLEVIETIADISSRPVFQRLGIRRLLRLTRDRKSGAVIADSMFAFGEYQVNSGKPKGYPALLDELRENGVRVQLLYSTEEL